VKSRTHIDDDKDQDHPETTSDGDGQGDGPAVRSQVRNTFEAFDADKTGLLDHKELTNALKFYGIDVVESHAADVIAKYDLQDDGKMQLDEFVQLVHDIESGAPLSNQPLHDIWEGVLSFEDRLARIFQAFDADKNGGLDYKELKQALQFYGLDTTYPEAAAIIKKYDDQPDGKMQMHEFISLVRDIENGIMRHKKHEEQTAGAGPPAHSTEMPDIGAGVAYSAVEPLEGLDDPVVQELGDGARTDGENSPKGARRGSRLFRAVKVWPLE